MITLDEFLEAIDYPERNRQGNLKEILMPWQIKILSTIEKSLKLQVRNIDEVFILTPKKNGKSLIAAIIALFELVRSEFYNNEVLILSPTKASSKNIFNPLVAMIKNNQYLNDNCKIKLTTNEIIYKPTNSIIQITTPDVRVLTGNKANLILIDELWQFKANRFYDIMIEALGGSKFNQDFMVVYTSTMSEISPTGFFADKLTIAREVAKNKKYNKRFVSFLYELGQGFSHINLPTIKQILDVNPTSKIKEAKARLMNDYTQVVKSNDPIIINNWLAKYANCEPASLITSQSWSAVYYLDNINHKTQTFEEVINSYDWEICYFGFDGGGSFDFSGLACLLVRHDEEDNLHIHYHSNTFYMKEALEFNNTTRDKARQLTNINQAGLIQFYSDEFDVLKYWLDCANEKVDYILGIACDPNFSTEMQAKIKKTEYASLLVERLQGRYLVKAYEQMLSDIMRSRVSTSTMELLKWNIESAKVIPKGEIYQIEKDNNSGNKIDALTALATAYSLMIYHIEKGKIEL